MRLRVCNFEGCTKAHRARGLCSTHYNATYMRDHDKSTRSRYRVTGSCERCGTPFESFSSHRTRFCSRSCATLHVPRSRDRRKVAEKKLRRAAKGTCGKKVWHQGTCARCGEKYISSAGWGGHHCSAQCRRADKAADRRARKRAAFVAPVSRIAIFQRDDWTCQLCGIELDRSAIGPAPLAPTIDHIKPLANGGTHEPANVQAAHFLCNSTKSNREEWDNG
ncbi:HNH endonuclease [Streptomyces sp. NPDC048330]|uniref:HNH endonuclease n=1 Tax=Streptomyces sp. NPDC048330 TaxID=3365533 RepID=UPI003723B609